jgi:hypothetical protein
MTKTTTTIVGIAAFLMFAACEPCQNNEECGEAAYCSKPRNRCDGLGLCEDRPRGCPQVRDPVCGCDGQTYGSACEAAAEGVNVTHEGECEPAYCWSNGDCSDLQYCYFADCLLETGICLDRPEACLTVWEPVCGCDGQTYSNACYAAASGVSVDYEGECQEEDPAQKCSNTGGTPMTALCCQSVGDFPNTCLVGACGCAPESSHEVLVCACPEGQCFEPGVGCTAYSPSSVLPSSN